MSRRVAAIAFVVAVILAATWPTVTGDRFAFRDVSQFYLPLYDYVAQRTVDEWLPFWRSFFRVRCKCESIDRRTPVTVAMPFF